MIALVVAVEVAAVLVVIVVVVVVVLVEVVTAKADQAVVPKVAHQNLDHHQAHRIHLLIQKNLLLKNNNFIMTVILYNFNF